MRHALHASVFALALASLAGTLAVPRIARADDAALVEAQQRFQEGLDYADAGRHEPARLKFQQAWAVFKTPSVLYNLARAEQLTGHDLEALEHFKQFLKMGPDPKITDAQRDKAKQNVQDLTRKIGLIDLDAPPAARITVDGKVLEEPPKDPIPVAPGRHIVEAAFEGKLRSITIDCGAGSTVKATIAFEGGPTDSPRAGERTTSAGRWIVPTVLGVAGLVGLSIGVGFAVSSQNAKDEANAIRTRNPGLCAEPVTSDCSAYDGRRSDAQTASTISKVGYIGGGVLLASAVATFVLWPTSKEGRTTGATTVHPLIGGGVLGAGVGTQF